MFSARTRVTRHVDGLSGRGLMTSSGHALKGPILLKFTSTVKSDRIRFRIIKRHNCDFTNHFDIIPNKN